MGGILAALAGYSAVASYGTPFGRMGLDLWFDTHFVRRILGWRLVWDSLRSCGFWIAGLILPSVVWFYLLCEGPEPFVYGGEAGAHYGGDEYFREVVGFEFVAGEANESGTNNE